VDPQHGRLERRDERRLHLHRLEDDERLARLTPQERRILVLISEGLTNRQIAEEIHLAEKTVKNYVSGILSKMSFRRRSEAAAFIARRSASRF